MTALTTMAELYLGPTLGWVDVTSDVRQESASSGGGVTITRGRSNGASTGEPARASLVLGNDTGTYSPRNPNSAYYGLIGRNTPIRLRLPGYDAGTAVALPGRVYASGSAGPRVTTPDHASLHVTGDLDVRVWARHPGSWHTTGGMLLAARYDVNAGNNRSWFFAVSRTGFLRFDWSTDGTSTAEQFQQATARIAPDAGGSLAVRATLDVDNGSAGWTLRFWQASSLAGPWTQVGADVTGSGITSVFAGTAQLEVGACQAIGNGDSFNGELYGFQLRNGIDGTLVGSPDFTAMEVGDTTLVDAQGRTYTLDTGALVVDRGARFYGEVSSWPVKWDLSGTDVWVTVEAAGITRRLQQGSTPVRSPLYRTLLATSPAGYLPLEDGADATRPTSAVDGATGESTDVTFSADTSLAGAATVAKLNSTTSRIATSVVARTSSLWAWFVVFKLSAIPSGADVTFMRVRMTGGTVSTWEVMVSSTGYRWIAYNASGGTVDDHSYTFATATPDQWVAMVVQQQQNGANVDWGPVFHAVGSQTYYGGYTSFSYAGTLGRITSVEILGNAYTTNGLFSHLVANSSDIPLLDSTFSAVSTGYAGETAGQRMYRLAQEAGVPLVFHGAPVYTDQVGPQRSATFLELLQDAAAVDGGVLSECRGQLGLLYRTRQTLYNQPPLALSYTAGHISAPFEPTDDDQQTRNDITVTRSGGGSYRAVDETSALSVLDPPDGVGVYDTSTTLRLYSDSQLADQAHWALHLGTIDEARWPRIRVDLLSAAWQADATLTGQAALVDAGDVVTVDDLPAWAPPGPAEALVQGYTERIDPFVWDITWTATPASAYRVWELESTDGNTGRLDTAGSQLAAAATSTATLLSVATTSGPEWTPYPSDWPLDVDIEGEQVTVDAVYPAGYDAYARIVSSGWGTATTGQAWTTSGGSASDYSVGGG